MNEAEPSVVQAMMKSSLASIRNMEHRDTYGNAIGKLFRILISLCCYLCFPVPRRALHCRCANSCPAADPDRSNPTRSRWERPLDTIRSFEAAIDGGYNRKSIYRSDTESVANWNRRSSYYSSKHITPPRRAADL